MFRIALENELGALMLAVGGAATLAGLGLMLLSGAQGRLGQYGNGCLFVGLGLTMYPILNILAYGITDGKLDGVPGWVLTLPAIIGPLVGLPAAWWSFRDAKKMTSGSARQVCR